jgi:hypothetical protein
MLMQQVPLNFEWDVAGKGEGGGAGVIFSAMYSLCISLPLCIRTSTTPLLLHPPGVSSCPAS